MLTSPSHIIVGLSGGVDSAVAAFLLKEAGHHVEAIFMKNWEEDDTETTCPAAKDLADAEMICDKLKIPFQHVNFAKEYWQHVFTDFLAEYAAGRTPNPDILCNKTIKFKTFLDYAKGKGADYIATGHYVRKLQKDQQTYLLKGSDPAKDQSYFLHTLSQAQLAQSLFPVGELTKVAVRKIAKQIGLLNHDKKDSTGICFIGERKFNTFLNNYLPTTPGNIQTVDGEIMGQHAGLMYYTIGQRQGLNIGGKRDKSGEAWYVVGKNIPQNILLVAQGEHPALFKSETIISNLHWINTPHFGKPLKAKTRYRQPDQTCTVEELGISARVKFTEPQRAITPGQSIVFYQDDICLGGGIINNDC